MRILYVEDTLLNLCLIERIARMGAHEVVNYAYAERALQYFDCDQPDLILVDLRLEGDMNGIDFIERIRAKECTKPIVVITAQTGDEVRERCMAAGATEYYQKPLMVRELVRLIQRYEKVVSQREPSVVASAAETVQTAEIAEPVQPESPVPATESAKLAETTELAQTAPFVEPAKPAEPAKPTAEPAESAKPASSAESAKTDQAEKVAKPAKTDQTVSPASSPASSGVAAGCSKS